MSWHKIQLRDDELKTLERVIRKLDMELNPYDPIEDHERLLTLIWATNLLIDRGSDYLDGKTDEELDGYVRLTERTLARAKMASESFELQDDLRRLRDLDDELKEEADEDR